MLHFKKSFFLYLITVLFFVVSCAQSEESPQTRQAETRDLEFVTTVSFSEYGSESVSTIRAAVADDDASRSEGLMDVHNLPSDAGMLFIFDGEEPRSFWMANTPISLDIIFANSDFEIVRIHRNTPPYSHESIQSELPAKYVVEVNAGYTMQHDIREGMFIILED
ncbi:MAG: DUF192 domain-containing protein [Balneolaceae bacterium]|nr:MAG: DUF192 domain-containing protein [Balneolaceae bacterium]